MDEDAESKDCQSPVHKPEGYVREHSPTEVEKPEWVGVEISGVSKRCILERGCLRAVGFGGVA